MRKMMTAWLIALFLAVLAIASGCEDSPVTVGKDFQMFLLANPASVRIDGSDDTAVSTLVATIVNAAGAPQRGILVFFSSDGGELASNPQGIKTDSNGNAFATLTVSAQDQEQIKVTATSTTLTDTATVTKACSNSAPTADFSVTSPTPGAVGVEKTVTPTDVSANDVDGQVVSYTWDCGNATPVVTTPTPSPRTCTYTVEATTKIYTIKLTVKDDGLDGNPLLCQRSSTVSHTVTVAKTP